MKNRKRVISLLMTAMLAVGLFSGCGKEEGDASGSAGGDSAKEAEVTIRMAWQSMAGTGKEKLLLGAIEDLETQYPNLTVEIENAESGKYASKISMDVSTDNTPDVFSFWRPEASYGTDKFIEAGALADLSELLEDKFFKGKFEDSAIATCSYDGKLYGIPENYAYIVNAGQYRSVGRLRPGSANYLG